MIAANKLRRHGDYQRVYQSSRKRFGKQMSYFFLLRDPKTTNLSSDGVEPFAGPRVGLTVSRAMGNAVQRNRIKRRVREAVRQHIDTLHAPVDVVLHPQRRVAQIDFALLEADLAQVFRAIQHAVDLNLASPELQAAGKRP